MKELDEKVTLLISSCQKFSDLWDAHVHFLNINWGDRPKNTLIVTDEVPVKTYQNIKVFPAGNGLEMSYRIKAALQMIDTEYVLLTLDDYFLTKPIKSNDIMQLISFADKENIDYIRLFALPREITKVRGEAGLFWINLEHNYAVNLYPGLWRKSFLLSVISAEFTAWDFEISLTKRAKELGAHCVMSRRNEFRILDVVRKGKVLHKANRVLKKQNIDIGDRPLVSYKTEFRYFVVGLGSQVVPNKYTKYVKQVLSKFGMKFYSNQ